VYILNAVRQNMIQPGGRPREVSTMSIWTVELEPGVWIAPWEGDPGRTLVKQNAEKFNSRDDAKTALVAAREYRPFAKAAIASS